MLCVKSHAKADFREALAEAPTKIFKICTIKKVVASSEPIAVIYIPEMEL